MARKKKNVKQQMVNEQTGTKMTSLAASNGNLTMNIRSNNGKKITEHPNSGKAKSTNQNKNIHQANGNISSAKSPGGMHKSPSANTLGRLERQKFVIWKRPFRTLKYFVLELAHISWTFIKSLFCIRRLLPIILILSLFAWLYLVPGYHTFYLKKFEKKIIWCLYWIGLGVLSSVGLGTGLHTFILYLGPHIARVTLAAFECNSLDFPEPPYPDDVTCPTSESLLPAISLWAIISKVRLESLMWGAGTAMGELPPYFMAKAARLSGEEPDDEEYKEFISLVESNNNIPKQVTLMDTLKLKMEQIVTRAGFPGILLFASIPNPFFDLAGITCGHFLIPFWTFFGATLIGKAIVKMHLQMFCVVLTFSEHHFEHFVSLIKKIPHLGPFLQAPLREFLQAQKLKLHRQPNDPIPEEASSFLQQVLSYFVTAMIVWFIISLINSLAQQYHKRMWENEKTKGYKLKGK